MEADGQFEFLADALPQLVWTANSSGVVDYYNARRTLYAGGDRSTDRNDWQPLIHPDDLEATQRAWQTAAESGAVYQFEHRIQMADGSYRWHLSRAVPIAREDRTVVKWFGTATDVDERKRAEEQLIEIAYTLQHALLPTDLPRTDDWTLAARYQAATTGAEVGGDWYDAVLCGDVLTLVIGDVAGHSSGAAAVMGAARHAIAVQARSGASPSEVLTRANEYLLDLEASFVTSMLVSIELKTGHAVASTAGHPPAVVFEPDRPARVLDIAAAPPLACIADAQYTETAFEIPRGGGCFLYTDGLVERRGELLDVGLRRLTDQLDGAPHRAVQDVCDQLLVALGADAEDDVALLAVHRT